MARSKSNIEHKRMRRSFVFSFLILSVLSSQAWGSWWNDSWGYAKELTLDTTATGLPIDAPIKDVPVLVRLHAGNFGYFLDLKADGSDLRFIGANGLTPLPFHVEKLDPVNELGFVWVRVPTLTPQSRSNIRFYYGNPTAVTAADAAATYDSNQVLVYHFSEPGGIPKDQTANANNPLDSTASTNVAGFIGGSAHFSGESYIRLPNSPTLQVSPENGWTLSTWIKFDALLPVATLMEQVGNNASLLLAAENNEIYAQLTAPDGTKLETPRTAALDPGVWYHLAVVISENRLSLFVNGTEVSYLETAVPVIDGQTMIGSAVGEEGFSGFRGDMDELAISNVARSAQWLKFAASSQGQAAALITYGEDVSSDSDGGVTESYFLITLHNVTVDGWVVIVVLAIMAAISWLVMIGKGIVIGRVHKDNAAFIKKFGQLSAINVHELDMEDSEDDRELGQSPLMQALSGQHEHFQSSNLYRLYHVAIQEMSHRLPKAAGAQAATLLLTPQAIESIRAVMDGAMVREGQKLNSQMVLLTIAISGGPFLGLLGTVVGVMITFAAIAASGDVNVNAIAPGIAAALVATVAGLVVAIPALFGYNYLGTRIKEIHADMRVFVDEFVTKVAEEHS